MCLQGLQHYIILYVCHVLQKNRYQVVHHLLQSEAAFLTSLKIATEVGLYIFLVHVAPLSLALDSGSLYLSLTLIKVNFTTGTVITVTLSKALISAVVALYMGCSLPVVFITVVV